MDTCQIKAVFFDAADTLFRVKGGVGDIYWDIARKYGADSTPEQIQKTFIKAFKSAPPLAFSGVSQNERKAFEKQWWYDIVKMIFLEIGLFEKFNEYFDELYETFRSKAWELFPETKDVLSSLKGEGLILGIISNFDSRIYDVCTGLEIIDYFDSFVISSEAGFAKPSSEIFNMALDRNKVSASQSIHVGDSLEYDFYGARLVGIRPLLFDNKGKYKTRDDVDTIESLAEVIGFINES